MDIVNTRWILCPICGNKTRLKMREDTELKNLVLLQSFK
ncbi:cysteine-rich KTR domain-containing protein [Lactococcus lactis]|nr:cysteine-rich KTR domain-containing protein [Lactococcus lactis]